MNQLIKTDNEILFSTKFILKKNGLEITGDPSFDEWIECGNFIKRARGAVHFWIGDWLNYGERKWGEKYREAIEMTGFDYQTLRNDKWVTAQIPPERRKTELSFDHHMTVANLDEDEQDELLEKAATNNLPSKEFRKVVENNDLSRRQDKQVDQHPQGTRENEDLAANDVLEKAAELTEALNKCNIEMLSEGARKEMFLGLKVIKDLIVGLEIKYD